ncbi:MAG: dihydroorotate dehydrogenase electron transfer subunit [Oscillospiraceae bacterium]|nr:dihydroorotate dehydrogenase electron transfer subunit [Oscillospiraceae bacterium]
MERHIFTVIKNENIADKVYKMVLYGDTKEIKRPGQFVNILVDGFYLRRPISVCDWDENTLTLIYKVFGGGTKKMGEMPPGARFDVLTGLGNGFNTDVNAENPLIIGGGVGVPPLYALAKELILKGMKTTVILGFNTKKDVFFEHEFIDLGSEVIVATADGSYGAKGFVTEAVINTGKDDFDYYYSCGPEAMLRVLLQTLDIEGQLSFEERMGCGFGACMGCSCETLAGYKRICHDGPVLYASELIKGGALCLISR